MVGVLQVLLQSRRLNLSQDLPEAQTLADELMTCRAKVPAADNEALDWHNLPHDDLALACAIAAWQAERVLGYGMWYQPYVLSVGRGWPWRPW